MINARLHKHSSSILCLTFPPVTTPTLEEEIVAQRERMELLVSAFSNTQQDQYEIFRRATFPKSTIKKIMQGVCGGTVPPNAVIAMSGITKVSAADSKATLPCVV